MNSSTLPALVGHFDRQRTLIPFLEGHKASKPEPMSLPEYQALGVRAQASFNVRRIERIAGNTDIMTPGLRELMLEVRRAAVTKDRPVGRTGVVLSGKPTTGKTTAARHAMVEGLARHARQYPEWKKNKHCPVVYVEVPSSCTPKNLMGCFLNFFDMEFTSRMTAEERTELVVDRLIGARTSLIVIDEMQNMAFDSRGHSETQQATKNLMNAVPAVPLYVGFNLENRLDAATGLGEQFAGRSAYVGLEHFTIDNPDERKLWAGIIFAFEQQLGLLAQAPKSLPLLGDYLWARTRGSIGSLSRLLTTAALELIAEGVPEKEVITQERLETVRLDMRSERAYARENADAAKSKKVTSDAE